MIRATRQRCRRSATATAAATPAGLSAAAWNTPSRTTCRSRSNTCTSTSATTPHVLSIPTLHERLLRVQERQQVRRCPRWRELPLLISGLLKHESPAERPGFFDFELANPAPFRLHVGAARGIGTSMTDTLQLKAASTGEPPRISFVSLGCPKALVDSERIITQLRAEGYELTRRPRRARTPSSSTPAASSTAPRRNRSTRSARRWPKTARSSSPAAWAPSPNRFATASQRAGDHRPAGLRERHGRGASGRAARARSFPRSGAAAGREADAAPLRLSEDFGRLQQPLLLLHHPQTARRSRLAPGRRRAARSREAGEGRRQGIARHLAGHVGLRRST